MRYAVVNLGQECPGGVCPRPKPPPAEYTPPARSVTQADALRLADRLAAGIESASECFPGEDLTVAYSLEAKLRNYGTPNPAVRVPALLDLNEEEARVTRQAETCVIQTFGPQPTPLQPTATVPRMTPAAASEVPIVPIAIGAGALGLLALIVSVA